MESNLNNKLCEAADQPIQIQIEEKIAGVINLMSLFQECYTNYSTKDLISIAFNMDLSCSLECAEQIEVDSRFRLLSDKETHWKQLQVGRICGSTFKDGKFHAIESISYCQ